MKVLGPGSEPFLIRDKEGKEPEELDEKKAMMPTELLGAKHPPKEEDRDDS